MSNHTFETYQLGSLQLSNRIVMAPMTRSRAINNTPNELMAKYYSQRAGAGLIITEGTSPSPNGLGYARIPGVFSDEQVAGWKLVTDAVHEAGGKIFLQIMHTGRVSHPLNMAADARVIAPSAIGLTNSEMWTDQEGNQPYPVPAEMTAADIQATIAEYVTAAKNAVVAGFDGVELHAANGYLLDQFIHPDANQRTDEYGGSVENRLRFVLEVAQQVVDAIGAERTGIRISPYGVFNELSSSYDSLEETYQQLASRLSDLNLVYLHLVDHSAMGAPEVPESVKELLRKNFSNTFILSGGYDLDRAEQELAAGKGDLVAFGRPFISNPDLPQRLQAGTELDQPNFDQFYTPGEEGYTDYPTAVEKQTV
ncbi:MAG: alkene reductase [Bacteroidota bacterium]